MDQELDWLIELYSLQRVNGELVDSWQMLQQTNVIAAILKVWRHTKIRRELMDIYKKNNTAKFSLDLIWINGTIRFF